MIANLTAGVIGGLKNVLKIVALVVLVIGVIKWAQAHPADAQAMIDKGISVGLGLINWVLDQITALTA